MTPDGFVRVDDACRTSVANVCAIGELVSIGGVDKALLEGQIAAGIPLSRHRVIWFASKLAETFALRPELFQLARPDTIICRCEDIPLAAIQSSASARDAKLQTRCGMGPYQAE